MSRETDRAREAEAHDKAAAISAEIDQAAANIRAFTPVVAAAYRGLRQNGTNRADAIAITGVFFSRQATGVDHA